VSHVFSSNLYIAVYVINYNVWNISEVMRTPNWFIFLQYHFGIVSMGNEFSCVNSMINFVVGDNTLQYHVYNILLWLRN